MDVLQVSSPVLMLCLGGAFLVLGYRLVKVVAVVNLAVLGVVVGYDVAQAVKVSPAFWGSVIGGVLFGLLAIPLLRAAVVVAVAALVGLIAKNVWVPLGGDPPLQWAALAGGFVVGAILALLCYRFIMITTASVMGAGLLVYGAASLLAHRMIEQHDIERAQPAHVVGAVAAFAVLVLVGILAQYRGARRLRAAQGMS